MGLSIEYIKSDPSHYDPFVCKICEAVVDLDALVTEECSHPFCRSCLSSWHSNDCPSCHRTGFSSSSLSKVQPLAHVCLSKILVECPGCQAWVGEYAQLSDHEETCSCCGGRSQHVRSGRGSSCSSVSAVAARDRSKSPLRNFRMESFRKRVPPVRSVSARMIPGLNQFHMDDFTSSDDDDFKKTEEEDDDDDCALDSNTAHSLPLLSSSASVGNASKISSRQSIASDEGVAPTSKRRTSRRNMMQRSSSFSINNGRLSRSVSPGPVSSRRRRSSSRMTLLGIGEEDIAQNNSDSLSRTISKNKEMFASLGGGDSATKSPRRMQRMSFSHQTKARSPLISLSEDEEEEEGGDNATTITTSTVRSSALPNKLSRGLNGRPALSKAKSAVFFRDSLPKAKSSLLGGNSNNNNNHSGISTTSATSKMNMASILLLKEEGNTKFNRGAHREACGLYTKALNLIQDFSPTMPQERLMIASLYGNRGATFLKDREYQKCIDDCDEAIRLSPTFVKAYTRKWKGLMGMGKVDDAIATLATAIDVMPEEECFREDLEKTRDVEDRQMQIKYQLKQGDYDEAKEGTDSLLRLVETPESLLLAAEADACNGIIDTSLERCEIVLKSNSKHVRALTTKGYVTLLNGDADSAALLVKEALSHDPDNSGSNEILRICRKIQQCLVEGRACCMSSSSSSNPFGETTTTPTSKSVLKKAIENFSEALADENIPTKSRLHSQIRAERGEVSLLLLQYQAALTDALVALESDPHNIRAWVVKGESLIGLKRAKDARDELKVVKHTAWGKDKKEIEQVYSKADFEIRVHEQDMELRDIVQRNLSRQRSKLQLLKDCESGNDSNNNSNSSINIGIGGNGSSNGNNNNSNSGGKSGDKNRRRKSLDGSSSSPPRRRSSAGRPRRKTSRSRDQLDLVTAMMAK